MRMIQIQDNISEQKNLKDKLESEQEKLHVEYNKVSSCFMWCSACEPFKELSKNTATSLFQVFSGEPELCIVIVFQ